MPLTPPLPSLGPEPSTPRPSPTLPGHRVHGPGGSMYSYKKDELWKKVESQKDASIEYFNMSELLVGV